VVPSANQAHFEALRQWLSGPRRARPGPLHLKRRRAGHSLARSRQSCA